jgi:organic radical activating enzyme
MKKYHINEFFFSLQGEGMRAGEPSIFLRFSGCNLKCNKEEDGFDCDTEFTSSHAWTVEDLIKEFKKLAPVCKWIVLTGGEPSLQIDDELIDAFHAAGYKLAIETNGTKLINPKIDWISVSPKVAEHCLKQKTANEVKYVRSYGMGIPKTVIKADHYLISPAFEVDHLPDQNLKWCVDLVKEHEPWRLSVQMHKSWQIR